MTQDMHDRACRLAVYMMKTGGTVRSCASHFGISKSTVHKDLTQRLPYLDPVLYRQIQALLQRNKQQRHIRGGMATREKYRSLKENRE